MAWDDHIGAVTELSLFRNGDLLGRLVPEQRFHPNMVFPERRSAFLRAKASHGGDPAVHRAAVASIYDLIRDLEGRAGREVKTPSTEVSIHASLSPISPTRFGEDFYVIPLWVDPVTGQANFRVFVNPMVNFLWLGGLILVLGAHLSVLPDSRERMRLETAMTLEERAAEAA